MFTTHDEERERSTVTPKEMEEIIADVHGMSINSVSRPVSEDDASMIREALRRLDVELRHIPDSRKPVFLEAQREHPELVGDSHKALFLRVEDLDAKLAAERLVKYWHERHQLFGSEKCFLPLTLKGALREDFAALSQGVFQLLPFTDSYGRAILFCDASRIDKSKYSSDSLLRALWYLNHVALENPEVQRKGRIGLIFGKNGKLDQFDGEVNKSMTYHMQSILPLKERAIHFCHPPAFIWVLLPILKFFYGRRMRLRFNLHSGSEESVLQDLSRFGLTPDVLPKELGGEIVLDTDNWIAERLDIESSQNGAWKPCEGEEAAKKARNEPPASKRRGGRKGDFRMNEAVEARMNNPSLSLLEALVAGGFEFSRTGERGLTDKKVFDANGISLFQRKNQLNRRLRKVNKKRNLPSSPLPLQGSLVSNQVGHVRKAGHSHSVKCVSQALGTRMSDLPHASNSEDSPTDTHRDDVCPESIGSALIDALSVNVDLRGIKREDSHDSFDDLIDSLPGVNNIG